MAKWTTEQVERVLEEARERGNWRGTPEQHMLAVLADVADWLLGESRAQRQALRDQLAAAVASGEMAPETLRALTAHAARGPAEDDDDIEVELEASVRVHRAPAVAGA